MEVVVVFPSDKVFPLMRALLSLSEELDLEDVMDIELDFPTLPEALSSSSSSLLPVPSLKVSCSMVIIYCLIVFLNCVFKVIP